MAKGLTPIKDLGEFGLIDRISKKFKPSSKNVLKGIGDDAAVVSHEGENAQVFSTDMLIEGVHFIGHESPTILAKKALRVNVSDIAAMGARPYAYSITTALPPALCGSVEWIAAFCQGLAEDQEQYHVRNKE